MKTTNRKRRGRTCKKIKTNDLQRSTGATHHIILPRRRHIREVFMAWKTTLWRLVSLQEPVDRIRKKWQRFDMTYGTAIEKGIS